MNRIATIRLNHVYAIAGNSAFVARAFSGLSARALAMGRAERRVDPRSAQFF
jgi:hypothetical protein